MIKPSDYCWHVYENKTGQCVISERKFRKKEDAVKFFQGLIRYSAEHITYLNTWDPAHDPYQLVYLDDKREYVLKYGPGPMNENAREEFIIYYQS